MWQTLILLSVLLACLGVKHCLRHPEAVMRCFEYWERRLAYWRQRFEDSKPDWEQRFDRWKGHWNWKQHFNDWKRQRQFRRAWHQTILDSSSLCKKIESVRHDPVGALGRRPRSAARRAGLVASMRDSILRLPYFRNWRKESPLSEGHETNDRPA
jgi:hypothetical protein